MNKKRGNTQRRKVTDSKLGRLSRRMQRIREQQESVGQTGIFGRDHARLPAAVGLAGEMYGNAGSLLPKELHSLTDAFAVALA
ncbi:MAG: hypothetical protein JWO19_2745 [Bryobacterales bacterium]|nr:hypothetical protein [Bryobacterales bacterium]